MAVPIHPAPDTHSLEAGAPVSLFPSRLAIGGSLNAAQAALEGCAPYHACFNPTAFCDVSHDMGFSRFMSIGKMTDLLGVMPSKLQSRAISQNPFASNPGVTSVSRSLKMPHFLYLS
jgi:hypothetical protein